MNPSRLFILRPVATSLLMVAMMLVGIVAYRQLPVSALPQVDYPTIQVMTFYPGAAPDVMASSVTAPLERQFGQVPGLNQMTSTSSFGSSLITLQFALDQNIDVEEQQVQAAINAADDVPAAEPSQSSDLQQGESGRCAHPDAGADLGFAAAVAQSKTWPTPRWRRRFRSFPESAWFPSAAGRSRRFDPGQSDRAGLLRAEPGRRSHGTDAGQCGSSQGSDRWSAPVVHHRRQRPTAVEQAI